MRTLEIVHIAAAKRTPSGILREENLHVQILFCAK